MKVLYYRSPLHIDHCLFLEVLYRRGNDFHQRFLMGKRPLFFFFELIANLVKFYQFSLTLVFIEQVLDQLLCLSCLLHLAPHCRALRLVQLDGLPRARSFGHALSYGDDSLLGAGAEGAEDSLQFLDAVLDDMLIAGNGRKDIFGLAHALLDGGVFLSRGKVLLAFCRSHQSLSFEVVIAEAALLFVERGSGENLHK